MDLLLKLKDLQSKLLENIKTTYHTIDLEEVSSPLHQQPYRARQISRVVLREHLDMQP